MKVLKIILPYTLILVCMLFCNMIAGNVTVDEMGRETTQIISLREIGHELLLQSGDSSSRVLPIHMVNSNEYQIRFEKELSFKTDSLVSIVKRMIARSSLPDKYTVTVSTCISPQIVYGYIVKGSKKNDVVPCLGRVQPKACYAITIRFQEATLISAAHQVQLFRGAPVALLLGYGLYVFVILRKKKRAQTAKEILLGETIFDTEAQLLTYEKTKTSLTDKESRLLLIFAHSPNEVIDRTRIQKEIWEDEGVIVGRSLDMFISKLRKKLESDQSIRITNIHGKGYKLETIPNNIS